METTRQITIPLTGLNRRNEGIAYIFFETVRIHHFTRVAVITQERKANINKNLETLSESATFTRRIGSTTYRVSVHFTENSSQTMTDKILRLIQNQDLASQTNYAMIDAPQMRRQSERSA